MTVAGLRFRNKTYATAPSVTKNGVFIYDGNPADYREWEFRTELRIVAFEQQEKRRKKKEKKNDDPSFESSGGPEQGRAERPRRRKRALQPVGKDSLDRCLRRRQQRGPRELPEM